MAGNGEIFLDQIRQAQQLDTGILTMPAFREARIPAVDANVMKWEVFREKMEPFGIVNFGESFECLLTSKDTAWGAEDLNIFAGGEHQYIHEITDLTSRDGEQFLGLNFLVAQELVDRGQAETVQVNIGFNPTDFSAGHHSILKLHSHLRATPHPSDLERRQHYAWRDLERFDKLAFIEPFAGLHHDFIECMVRQGLFESKLEGMPEKKLGYTSMRLHPDNPALLFDDLQSMYRGLRNEYTTIQHIFTEGDVDTLGRFTVRPRSERQEALEWYKSESSGLYSDSSWRALEYLCEHITAAEARDPDNPRDMSTAAKVYLSRGFAGAMTFTFERGVEGMRFDFLPRVITTSGVTKTIMGENLPTVIAKTESPALEQERLVAGLYHRRVMGIVRDFLPHLITTDRFAHAA